MAITRPAPGSQALWIASCATGPQPHTATVPPDALPACSVAR